MTALSNPAEPVPATPRAVPRSVPTLQAVYAEHLDFVWRTLRQLGVPEAALEDVAHDVFLVVHRKLGDFDEARGTMRSWLYGISRKVADHTRRSESRRRERIERAPAPTSPQDPERVVAHAQAVDLVQEFLDSLEPERREVFFMIEIQEMSAPEIAAALDIKLNTVYSRLRRARAQFTSFVAASKA